MTKIANWIKELPPGVYLIRDLKIISGNTSGTSILGQMLKHGASAKKRPCANNLWEYVLKWPGFLTKQRK